MTSIPSVTIHDIPAETYRALRVRAVAHGRSTEAEIMAILECAVRPENRIKLGTRLAETGRTVGGVDLQIERDKISIDPMSFE